MAVHIDTSKVEVRYGEFRFNPAPLIAYSQESNTNEAGTRVSDHVTLTLNGTVLNLDNTSLQDLSSMITRRDAFINSVSGDGRELRVIHGAGGSATSGTNIIANVFPKVTSLEFTEGIWTNRINYTLVMEYDTNYASGQVPVENFGDDWSFEEDSDKRVIRITHSVQAKGIDTSVSGSSSTTLTNARTWVLARMGVGSVPAGYPAWADSGVLGVNKFQRYRTESASLTEGTYSASEEITMASGNYANSYTVQMQTDEAGIATVTINGNIEGLGRFDTAIGAAVSGWNIYVQPVLSGIAYQSYVELSGNGTLNLNRQQSLSVSKDPFNGNVGYSVTYNDNPAEDLPSGISEIQITKQVNFPVEKTAVFEIPRRLQGSIVHRLGTPTDGNITINGTVAGVPETQLDYVKTVAEDEVNSLRPSVALYNELWLNSKSVTENDIDKSLSFSLTWGFTDNFTSVQSPSGDIAF